MLDQNLVAYAWLAQSTGWGGTKTFTRWNIRQGIETTVCGLDSDLDESVADFGAFRVV